MSDQPSTWEVARRGIALVVEEVSRRGARATPDPTPRARNRLVVRTPDGRRNSLYIKTRHRGDWQTDTRKGQPQALDPQETSFWVFVDLMEQPVAYYIAPESWMANDIYDDHARYLARHGGRRAQNPSTTHHKIKTDRVAQWRDRWDLLGLDAYEATGRG